MWYMSKKGCYWVTANAVLWIQFQLAWYLDGQLPADSITSNTVYFNFSLSLHCQSLAVLLLASVTISTCHALIGHAEAKMQTVTGYGRLQGNTIVVGRKSPHSLYNEKIASFEDDEGLYDQKDAAGFIKLQV